MKQKIENIIDFIYKNSHLNHDLNDLSSQINISKFHFHREFSKYTGETPGEFCRRVRLERAANNLLIQPYKKINDIAKEFHFSTAQNFTRAFKKQYRLTPKQLKTRGCFYHFEEQSGIDRIPNFKFERDVPIPSKEELLKGSPSFTPQNGVIKIQRVQSIPITSYRCRNDYQKEYISEAVARLWHWGKSIGLVSNHDPIFTLFWDQIASTPPNKRRFDVAFKGITPTKKPKWIRSHTLDSGLYAIYQTTVKNLTFSNHWKFFLQSWFPKTGLDTDNRPRFQIARKLFLPEEQQSLQCEFYFPIKELP